MENTSDVWNNATTSSSGDDVDFVPPFHVRDLALKVVYTIMGTVGILGNLFVIIVFIFFIKIADKVPLWPVKL